MLFSWLRQWAGGKSQSAVGSRLSSQRRPGTFRPRLEGLEDRQLLASALLSPPIVPPTAFTATALVAPQTATPTVSAQARDNSPAALAATAAPTVPAVTGDSLNWSDFREIPRQKGKYTAYTSAYPYIKYDPERLVNTGFYNKKWMACVTARPANLEVGAIFDSTRSTVVRGRQTADLLMHERVHLQIVEHVTAQMKPRFEALRGYACVTSSTEAKAAKAAIKRADADLKKKVTTLYNQMNKLIQEAQKAYDTQTDHGNEPFQQGDWAANYQDYLNEMIKHKFGE